MRFVVRVDDQPEGPRWMGREEFWTERDPKRAMTFYTIEGALARIRGRPWRIVVRARSRYIAATSCHIGKSSAA